MQFNMASLVLFLLLHVVHATWASTNPAHKNVLFIISDDMRPDLGVYAGEFAPTPVYPPMHTPNLDALAHRSLLLQRAYVQYPLCGPSRASFLTGRRPETTRVYDLQTDFRDTGNFTTLPQFFKQNGYKAIGMGKVFHDVDEISWWDVFMFILILYYKEKNSCIVHFYVIGLLST